MNIVSGLVRRLWIVESWIVKSVWYIELSKVILAVIIPLWSSYYELLSGMIYIWWDFINWPCMIDTETTCAERRRLRLRHLRISLDDSESWRFNLWNITSILMRCRIQYTIWDSYHSLKVHIMWLFACIYLCRKWWSNAFWILILVSIPWYIVDSFNVYGYTIYSKLLFVSLLCIELLLLEEVCSNPSLIWLLCLINWSIFS